MAASLLQQRFIDSLQDIFTIYFSALFKGYVLYVRVCVILRAVAYFYLKIPTNFLRYQNEKPYILRNSYAFSSLNTDHSVGTRNH